MAVKILIKRRIKEGNIRAASRLLINNRTGAMNQPGYIASETLRSIDDPNQIVIVSMWQSVEDWEAWQTSKTRIAYESEFDSILEGDAEYEAYNLGLALE